MNGIHTALTGSQSIRMMNVRDRNENRRPVANATSLPRSSAFGGCHVSISRSCTQPSRVQNERSNLPGMFFSVILGYRSSGREGTSELFDDVMLVPRRNDDR